MVSMPSWVARFTKLPLQRKAPMDQPMQVKLLKNKERRVVEMEELLTFHVQQNIQINKGRMDEVLQELMTFHDKQKIKIHRRQMREVFAELRIFQE